MAKAEKPAPIPKWAGAKLWPIERPKPYEHNARTHPPAEIELLAALLTKFGPDQPIVVDDNEIILKGHARQEAGKLAGMTEFPVVQRFGLSDDDKRAIRISDNAVPLMAGWDNKLVQFEIEALRRSGYQIALLGFGERQLVQFETGVQPPAAFGTHDAANTATSFCCPKCRYKWSGNPLAGEAKPAKPAKAKARQKKR